jgi:Ca-activated chloride channel homolog
VVNFNEVVSLMLPAAVSFTSDKDALQTAIAGSKAQGQTALYDAIVDALDQLQRGQGKRQALVILTDGGDNVSRHTFRQVLDTVKKSGAQLYCLGLYDSNDEDAKPGILRELAKESGGESYFPASVSQVTNAMQAIARDLREQYTLGFMPKEKRVLHSWRSIRVTVSGLGKQKLLVRTRPGYVF